MAEIRKETHPWFDLRQLLNQRGLDVIDIGEIKYMAYIVREPGTMKIAVIADGTPLMEDVWALHLGDGIFRCYESKEEALAMRVLRGIEDPSE